MSHNHGPLFCKPSELRKYLIKQLSFIANNTTLLQIRNALGEQTKIYIVGGMVRNLALGKNPGDLDLAISIDPDECTKKLTQAKLKVYPTGIEHGTLTVVINQENIELTTFRKPGPRNNGQFSDSIEEDLLGRDFTINAIAFDVQTSELIDPYKGLDDLSNGLLKAIVSAEDRIKEDPLRIMRMIRFGPALGFNLDSDLKKVAQDNIQLLSKVSIERIRDEFSKILLARNVRSAFDTMLELGLIEFIVSELLPSVNCEQNDFHTEDVYNHILSVVENSVRKQNVRLAALFHDMGKPATLSVGDDGRRHFYNHEQVSTEIADTVLHRLKYPNHVIKSVKTLVRYHMRPLTCGPAAVRRLIRDLGDEMDDWLKLKQADKTPTQSEDDFRVELNNFVRMLIAEKEKAKDPVYGKLAVNGDDLINLGMQPGKELGQVLKTLEEMVIEDPNLNNKEFLLEHARKIC